ncbi:hypothetical protein HDU98_009446 [Podochytrium sp. JEL0797]|nr:hypothetical protein HDU98_009446 [Podochytrium sp. JEL0797]
MESSPRLIRRDTALRSPSLYAQRHSSSQRGSLLASKSPFLSPTQRPISVRLLSPVKVSDSDEERDVVFHASDAAPSIPLPSPKRDYWYRTPHALAPHTPLVSSRLSLIDLPTDYDDIDDDALSESDDFKLDLQRVETKNSLTGIRASRQSSVGDDHVAELRFTFATLAENLKMSQEPLPEGIAVPAEIVLPEEIASDSAPAVVDPNSSSALPNKPIIPAHLISPTMERSESAPISLQARFKAAAASTLPRANSMRSQQSNESDSKNSTATAPEPSAKFKFPKFPKLRLALFKKKTSSSLPSSLRASPSALKPTPPPPHMAAAAPPKPLANLKPEEALSLANAKSPIAPLSLVSTIPNVSSREKKQEYKQLKILGHGVQGTVSLRLHTPTGSIVALKSMSIHAGENVRLAFRQEVEILTQTRRHAGIIRLLDFWEGKAKVYEVFDVCTGGDLEGGLVYGAMAEEEVVRMMAPLVDAVRFLHELGDIRPANIFLRRPITPSTSLQELQTLPVLADFGIATYARYSGRMGTVFPVPPAHIAPEVVAGGRFRKPADMFGLGVCFVRMLLDRDIRIEDQVPRLLEREGGVKKMSVRGREVLKGLLCVDPSERWTAERVISNEWWAEWGVEIVGPVVEGVVAEGGTKEI